MQINVFAGSSATGIITEWLRENNNSITDVIFILPVHAGMVIYGTRIIYPKNREVLVQLMNQSKNASLIQAWIDDGNTTIAPEKFRSYLFSHRQ